MKNSKKTEELVRKLFSGKISQEELEELNEWYDSFNDQTELTAFVNTSSNKQQIKNKLFDRIKKESTERDSAKRKIMSVRRTPNLGFAFSAVAVVLILVLVYFSGYTGSFTNTNEIQYIEKYNPKGKRSTLSLKDGTKIWLNSESTIKIPKKFASDKREIILSGEAYFEVAHNEKKPFIVKTEKLITKVLGTSFNIKAHKNENIQLTVTSGKVRAVKNKNTVARQEYYILEKDDQFTLEHNKDIIKKDVVDSEKFSAWKDGIIIFNAANLSEVEETLERWYNVEVHITDENLKDCKLVGEYHNEKLTNILESLKYSLDINYKFDKNEVIIYGNGCR